MRKGDSKILYESGHYFQEAMSWYHVTYLQAPLVRNVYAMISIAIIIATISLALLMNNLFPMKTTLRMVVKNENIEKSDDETIVIRNISQKYMHPTLSIAKIMIENYIQHREEYINPGLKSLGYISEKINKIENLSSKSVFREFTKLQETNAGFSAMFHNNVLLKVKIVSVEFDTGATFMETMLYTLYPGMIAKSAKTIFTTEQDGIVNKYLANVTFDISIPAKRYSKNVDFISKEELQKQEEVQNPDKAGLKEYLTGTQDVFDPNIQFKVTGYRVSRMGN